MAKIQLPNNWKPRQDQMALWTYLENGGLRAVEVAHRRWGKDDVALHHTACAAMQRVGVYWHMLPEAAQSRKAIWEAVNPRTGRRRIDEAFPVDIRANTRESDMFIRFKNGSTWQVVGSDNFDSLVGTPPIGLVFSEWAIADPRAWSILRPILAENGGWALFIYTPRGNNHGRTTYDFALTDPGWFAELTTVDDTTVFTPETLAQERKELINDYGPNIGESIYLQEYYCSFVVATSGKRVFPEFSRKLHVADYALVPVEPTEIIRGWDNTGLSPAIILTYLSPTGQWLIFKEFCFEDTGIMEATEAMLLYCGHALPPGCTYRDIADPAGNIRDSRKQTPAKYIQEQAQLSGVEIFLEDGIQTLKIRRESVAARLGRHINGQPAILIDASCGTLIDGFDGGYCYPEIGNSGEYGTDPVKNIYSHINDAVQYVATKLFSAAALQPKAEGNWRDKVSKGSWRSK